MLVADFLPDYVNEFDVATRRKLLEQANKVTNHLVAGAI